MEFREIIDFPKVTFLGSWLHLELNQLCQSPQHKFFFLFWAFIAKLMQPVLSSSKCYCIKLNSVDSAMWSLWMIRKLITCTLSSCSPLVPFVGSQELAYICCWYWQLFLIIFFLRSVSMGITNLVVILLLLLSFSKLHSLPFLIYLSNWAFVFIFRNIEISSVFNIFI